MGGDGGTCANGRVYMVKLKEKAKSLDRATIGRLKWTYCAVSYDRLRPPIVADRLGNLFNKDAILMRLLEKALVDPAFSHIQSMKDLITLTVDQNPDWDIEKVEQLAEDKVPAQFICPITQLEANGRNRFVCLSTCGHVLSERTVREAAGVHECLRCSKPYQLEDIIPINPFEEEIPALRERMEAAKAKQRKEKKASKKASSNASSVENNKILDSITPLPASSSSSSSIPLPVPLPPSRNNSVDVAADSENPSEQKASEPAPLLSAGTKRRFDEQQEKQAASSFASSSSAASLRPHNNYNGHHGKEYDAASMISSAMQSSKRQASERINMKSVASSALEKAKQMTQLKTKEDTPRNSDSAVWQSIFKKGDEKESFTFRGQGTVRF